MQQLLQACSVNNLRKALKCAAGICIGGIPDISFNLEANNSLVIPIFLSPSKGMLGGMTVKQ
jgi:hypothetical protein